MPDNASSQYGHLILAGLARRCIEELGVDAASIALHTGPSAFVPAYASNAVAAELEEYAFTVGVAPLCDALHGYAPVLVGDLTSTASQSRWPAWAARACGAGILAVSTFPIQLGAIVAGALTVYSTMIGSLDHDQVRKALRLADAAFLGLLDLTAGLAYEGPDWVSDDDMSTLWRGEVHRAAGMVMAQAGVTIETALARLRAYAFSSGRALSDVADDVVVRRLRFEADPDSAE